MYFRRFDGNCYFNCLQEELNDIIRYGSKELFADENDEAGKSRQIHYDDAAIDRYVLVTYVPRAQFLQQVAFFYLILSSLIDCWTANKLVMKRLHWMTMKMDF